MESPVIPLILFSILSSVLMVPLSSRAEGDLDRWQLHQMAAEMVEADETYFTGGDPIETSPESASEPTPFVAAKPTETMSPTLVSPTKPVVSAAAPKPTAKPPEKTIPSSAPKSEKRGWFSRHKKEPTIECLREEAHALARKGLTYQFGSDDPKSGGLDCSATVQYLYSSLGIEGVPRTSYLQYEWLKKAGTLHEVKGKNSTRQLLKKLRPGDLIFWGGTWKSGHKVSHVMIYLGRNPNTGEHFVFGARGKRVEGLLGSGVDVFVLNPDRGNLVGHGRVPGMRNS